MKSVASAISTGGNDLSSASPELVGLSVENFITQLESAKAPFRTAYFSDKKAEAARARGIDAFKTPLLLFWRRAYR